MMAWQLGCAVSVALSSACAAAQATSERAARSVVFDRAAAEALRPLADRVTVIFVEGTDPDARPIRRRPLERVFAEGLNPAPSEPLFMGVFTVLVSTPCPSLASTQTSLGTPYNPHFFCP